MKIKSMVELVEPIFTIDIFIYIFISELMNYKILKQSDSISAISFLF